MKPCWYLALYAKGVHNFCSNKILANLVAIYSITPDKLWVVEKKKRRNMFPLSFLYTTSVYNLANEVVFATDQSYH